MADGNLGERVTALLAARYGDGNGIEPWERADYLHAHGNFSDALLYSVLFVPEFIEVEGCVFLKEIGVEPQGGKKELAAGIHQARARSTEALKRYVDSFNWVEVPYLINNQTASDAEIEVLAELIMQTWLARLNDAFPDRRFTVRILDPATTGSVIGIGFEEEF
jgi:hypothetical protein